jgi:hypothetical protein
MRKLILAFLVLSFITTALGAFMKIKHMEMATGVLVFGLVSSLVFYVLLFGGLIKLVKK